MDGDGGVLAELIGEPVVGEGEVVAAHSSSGFGVDEEKEGNTCLFWLIVHRCKMLMDYAMM